MKITLSGLLMTLLLLGACQKDKKQTVKAGNGEAAGSSADATADWDGISHRGNSKYNIMAAP